jgi:GTP-binding protein
MSYRPVVAIIGRPNVGKSSLFNRLVGYRQAIVSPTSGTTRDRIYSQINLEGQVVDIIDTAGLSGDLAAEDFGHEMLEQVQLAVQEADALVFVLDAQAGLTHEDQILAEIIRKAETPTIVFINKVDNLDEQLDERLTTLGIGEIVLGSLAQRRGHVELKDALAVILKDELEKAAEPAPMAVGGPQLRRITLAGRPNVGKSTLFNALVGNSRAIVSDIPGTTRDTIDTKVTLEDGVSFIVTDTAGLRRRGKIGVAPKVEQYSVIRTFQAIDHADIVLVLADATEGLTRGDVHVANYALEQKKRLITVINKSDLIDTEEFNYRRFPFLTRHPIIFISAQEGIHITELLEQIREQLRSLDETPDQNSLLETE